MIVYQELWWPNVTDNKQQLEKLQCPYRDTQQEGIENAICHFLAI